MSRTLSCLGARDKGWLLGISKTRVSMAELLFFQDFIECSTRCHWACHSTVVAVWRSNEVKHIAACSTSVHFEGNYWLHHQASSLLPKRRCSSSNSSPIGSKAGSEKGKVTVIGPIAEYDYDSEGEVLLTLQSNGSNESIFSYNSGCICSKKHVGRSPLQLGGPGPCQRLHIPCGQPRLLYRETAQERNETCPEIV